MLTLRGKIVMAILVLLLVASGCYVYLDSLFVHRVRAPKYQLPVTYNIGWWPFQDKLTIDSLKVDIVDSKLFLFNAKSLVSYQVFGHLTYGDSWKPRIHEVFISERFDTGTAFNLPTRSRNRIIEIIPIVTEENNEGKNEGNIAFVFKNEHLITSNEWGRNYIRFVCGNKEQLLALNQRK